MAGLPEWIRLVPNDPTEPTANEFPVVDQTQTSSRVQPTKTASGLPDWIKIIPREESEQQIPPSAPKEIAVPTLSEAAAGYQQQAAKEAGMTSTELRSQRTGVPETPTVLDKVVDALRAGGKMLVSRTLKTVPLASDIETLAEEERKPAETIGGENLPQYAWRKLKGAILDTAMAPIGGAPNVLERFSLKKVRKVFDEGLKKSAPIAKQAAAQVDEEIKAIAPSGRFTPETVEEYWSRGEKGKSVERVVWQAIENTPQLAAMIAATATGLGDAALLAMGVQAAGEKYSALEKEIPDMDVDKRIDNALLTGTMEAGSEKLLGIGRWGKSLIKAVRQSVAQAGTQVAKSAVRRELAKGIGKNILAGLGIPAQEGFEEGIAQLGENALDKFMGVTRNGQEVRLIDGILESVLVGALASAPGGVVRAGLPVRAKGVEEAPTPPAEPIGPPPLPEERITISAPESVPSESPTTGTTPLPEAPVVAAGMEEGVKPIEKAPVERQEAPKTTLERPIEPEVASSPVLAQRPAVEAPAKTDGGMTELSSIESNSWRFNREKANATAKAMSDDDLVSAYRESMKVPGNSWTQSYLKEIERRGMWPLGQSTPADLVQPAGPASEAMAKPAIPRKSATVKVESARQKKAKVERKASTKKVQAARRAKQEKVVLDEVRQYVLDMGGVREYKPDEKGVRRLSAEIRSLSPSFRKRKGKAGITLDLVASHFGITEDDVLTRLTGTFAPGGESKLVKSRYEPETPQDELDLRKEGEKNKETNSAELQDFSLVWKNGEWSIIKTDEKTGDRKLADGKTVTLGEEGVVEGTVVTPDDPFYKLARKEFMAQGAKEAKEGRKAPVSIRQAELPGTEVPLSLQGEDAPDNARIVAEREAEAARKEVAAKAQGELPIGPGTGAGPGAAAMPRKGPPPIPVSGADNFTSPIPIVNPENEGNITSLRNAMLNVWAASMGFEPAQSVSSLAWRTSLDNALARLERNPAAGNRLIRSLAESPRALNQDDVAMLAIVQRQLVNARDELAQRSLRIEQTGNQAEKDAINQELNDLYTSLKELWDVAQSGTSQSKTMTAQGLNAFKMMLNSRYELENMEGGLRDAKKGADLTPEERSKLRNLSEIDKVAGAEDQAARREQVESEKDVEDEIERAVKVDKDNEVETRLSEIIDRFDRLLPKIFGLIGKEQAAQIDQDFDNLDAEVDSFFSGGQGPGAARAMGPFGQEFSPELLLRIGKTYFGKMAKDKSLTFKKWAKAVRRFIESKGGSISDVDLNDLYSESGSSFIDSLQTAETESAKKKIKRKKDAGETTSLNDLNAEIKQLVTLEVQNAVMEGRKPDRVEVITAVQKMIDESGLQPGITFEEVSDEFVDYLRPRSKLSKNPVVRAKAELRREVQLAQHLSRALRKIMPRKQGIPRFPPTREARELTRLLNNQLKVLKELGIVPENREQQLAAAGERRKTQLRNQIEELENALKTLQRIPRTRTNPALDAETRMLMAKRDALKARYEVEVPKEKLTDEQMQEQQIKKSLSIAERTLRNWEQRKKDALLGRFGKQAKVGTKVRNAELDAINAEIDKIKAEVAEMKELAFPKKSPLEMAVDAKVKRIERAIKELKRREAIGDFSTERRTTQTIDVSRNQRVLDAMQARAAARIEYEIMRGEAAWKAMGKSEHAAEILRGTSHAIRNLLASMDNSFVGRQGGWMMLTHPYVWSKTIMPSLMAGHKQRNIAINETLNQRRNHKNGIDQLTKTAFNILMPDGNYGRVEDLFRLDVLAHIPVIGKRGVKPVADVFNRMYGTAANMSRALFQDILLNANKRGQAIMEKADRGERLTERDKKYLKEIGRITNTFTGMSYLPGAEGFSHWLWAARFLKSTFEIVTMQPVIFNTYSLEARLVALKQYRNAAMSLILIYLIASLFDNDIEWDPRSSKFGNINVGKHHFINPLGSLKPMIVFLSRLISGQTKTKRGIENLREKWLPFASDTERLMGVRYGKDMDSVIARFGQTKEHPTLGLIRAFVTGEMFDGKPATLMRILTSFTTPMSAKQSLELGEDEGLGFAAFLNMVNFFGTNVDYDWDTKPEEVKREEYRKDLEERRAYLESIRSNMKR